MADRIQLYVKMLPMASQEIILNKRYKLLERVGAGGMALVYKARDLALGRVVAIKVLQESLASDEEFLSRFRAEAHRAANLAHPNIVTIHDIGQDGRLHYIVMEYVEGRTLKQLVRNYLRQTGRSLPIDKSLELAIQICAGIGYAHRADLVHCDVKPQNILITRDHRVKVADFGIARAISQSQISQQLRDQVWGTPQYFSPEQAAGESPTPASDVYSIGVILFEMLTGRLVFEADNHTALAMKHIQEPPPPVTRFNPAVPAQLEQIINKVLSKEPAGRYRTADQLGRILETYQSSSLQTTGPIAPVQVEADSTQPTPVVTTPINARPTEMYERPQPTPHPQRVPTAELKTEPPGVLRIPLEDESRQTDWPIILLALAAIVSLLGLIPLWIAVYLRWLT